MEFGGVYAHWALCIAHHPAEGVHLTVGDAGEVVSALFGFSRPVHQEVEDELGTTGYVVAVLFRTTDEDVARTENPVNHDALACAFPFVQLSLNGDVRDKSIVLVVTLIVFPLFVQDFEEFIQLVTAGFFCIGGYNGYEPMISVSHSDCAKVKRYIVLYH